MVTSNNRGNTNAPELMVVVQDTPTVRNMYLPLCSISETSNTTAIMTAVKEMLCITKMSCLASPNLGSRLRVRYARAQPMQRRAAVFEESVGRLFDMKKSENEPSKDVQLNVFSNKTHRQKQIEQ